MFDTGKGETIKHSDMENPNFRTALNEHHGLKKRDYNYILEMAQKKQFSRVKHHAMQCGVPEEEAVRLATVARVESQLSKHQKQASVKAHQRVMEDKKFNEIPKGTKIYDPSKDLAWGA